MTRIIPDVHIMKSFRTLKFRAINDQCLLSPLHLTLEQTPKTQRTISSAHSNGLGPWGESNVYQSPAISRPPTRNTRSTFRTTHRICSVQPQSLPVLKKQQQGQESELRATNYITKRKHSKHQSELVNRPRPKEAQLPQRTQFFVGTLQRKASLKSRMKEFFDNQAMHELKDRKYREDRSSKLLSLIKYSPRTKDQNPQTLRKYRHIKMTARLTNNKLMF